MVLAILVAGCTSAPRVDPPPSASVAPTTGPNWAEIDRTVERIKEREKNKRAHRTVETESKTEHGFFPMTEAEYATAFANASNELRKANPKWTEAEIEAEARKRADDAKRRHELTFQTRVSAESRIIVKE